MLIENLMALARGEIDDHSIAGEAVDEISKLRKDVSFLHAVINRLLVIYQGSLPEKAKWLGMDRDGRWWWSSERIFVRRDTLIVTGEKGVLCDDVKPKRFEGDWRKSIIPLS